MDCDDQCRKTLTTKDNFGEHTAEDMTISWFNPTSTINLVSLMSIFMLYTSDYTGLYNFVSATTFCRNIDASIAMIVKRFMKIFRRSMTSLKRDSP